MITFDEAMQNYLNECELQKRLSAKTIRAYCSDLQQFQSYIGINELDQIKVPDIESYIQNLHSTLKPASVKRKISSVKSFFKYLVHNGIIEKNPWISVECSFRESYVLPKIIPLYHIENLLAAIYEQITHGSTLRRRHNAIRDAAVCELLFATGMRVFELCSLKPSDVDLNTDVIRIHGKGSKERLIQIGNQQVHDILSFYQKSYEEKITSSGFFFTNQNGRPLSEQAIRRMLNRYVKLADIDLHITPHMFRHTFATSLLDADVDIRYIQKMLGHSSIRTTQIYTHVSTARQREILSNKHPRNSFDFEHCIPSSKMNDNC